MLVRFTTSTARRPHVSSERLVSWPVLCDLSARPGPVMATLLSRILPTTAQSKLCQLPSLPRLTRLVQAVSERYGEIPPVAESLPLGLANPSNSRTDIARL
jgi:hypothetical protein